MRLIILAACIALAGCGGISNQEQAALYSWINSLTPAQRNTLRADVFQCRYRAHSAATGYRGEIIQAAEERNLMDMCVKAKIAAIQASR